MRLNTVQVMYAYTKLGIVTINNDLHKIIILNPINLYKIGKLGLRNKRQLVSRQNVSISVVPTSH